MFPMSNKTVKQLAADVTDVFWSLADAAYLAWQSPFVQWPPTEIVGLLILNLSAWCRAWLAQNLAEPPAPCEHDVAFWRTPGAWQGAAAHIHARSPGR